MAAIDLGATTTVSWTPGATGATVVLTVLYPDGTTATPTVTEATGVYSAPVTCTQAGRYLLSWGKAAAPVLKYTDVLDVWPADPQFLITVEEAITAIRVSTRVTGTQFSDADRSDMRLFIAAATPVIEDIVGAVIKRTITQPADGGKSGVKLWERPASITSVTVDGATLTAGSGYTVNLNAGIVYAGAANAPTQFNPGRQNMTIVYVAGSVIIPPNIRTATATLVKRMWQQLMQAQGGVFDAEAPDDMTQTPSGYMVPISVYQLCRPSARIDGIG